MRALTLMSIVIAGIVVAADAAHAQKSCPADAVEASVGVWPTGSVKSGMSVTGTHPCGRRITCTGGARNTPGTRQCRWL
jgi:hypothetical protein